MADDCVMYNGGPLMVDYVPAADQVAGDVVVDNGLCLIFHEDVENGKLGAVSWPNGKAVYDAPAASADSWALGAQLYWHDTNNELTDNASGTTAIGFAAADKAANETRAKVVHDRT